MAKMVAAFDAAIRTTKYCYTNNTKKGFFFTF